MKGENSTVLCRWSHYVGKLLLQRHSLLNFLPKASAVGYTDQENKTKHGNSKPKGSISSQISQSQCEIQLHCYIFFGIRAHFNCILYTYILQVSFNVWWLYFHFFEKNMFLSLKSFLFYRLFIAFFIMINYKHFTTNLFIFKLSDTTVSIVKTIK